MKPKKGTSKMGSLEDFMSGPGCMTLFEELPGTNITKISGANISNKFSASNKKSKKSKPRPPESISYASNPAEVHIASDESPTTAKVPSKKRRRRPTSVPAEAAVQRHQQPTSGAGGEASDAAQLLAASDCDVSNWEVLHVPPPLLAGLAQLRFEQPTEIQRRCLPAAIKGRMDLVGAAETGSGKTLAFALPVLYGIMKLWEISADESQSHDDEESGEPAGASGPTALVLAPTRELAIQVKNHIIAVAKYTGIKVAAVVGGMSEQKQQRLLSRAPDVLVATPGRLWEFVEAGDPYCSNLSRLRFLVVDETDRMLEKGHFQQLHLLLERINADPEWSARRQNFVFSATLTLADATARGRDLQALKQLSPERKLKHITSMIGIRANNKKVVDLTRQMGTAVGLTEMAVSCSIPEKDELLYYFCLQHPGRTLVFCNSIDCVTRVTRLFTLLDLSPMALHARMQQRQRLKNLQRFQEAPAALLVATDVAARGLDVPGVQHVIHYQVPRSGQVYVHRSGRTARAHAEGLSLMLVEPAEATGYRQLLRHLNRDADLPALPLDSEVLAALAVHVRLARDINLCEHRRQRAAAARGWSQRAAQQMDIELDDQQLPEWDEATQRRLAAEQTARRRQLRALLDSRDDVWAPRTRHGRLSAPERHVPALEVARRSKQGGRGAPAQSASEPASTTPEGAAEPRAEPAGVDCSRPDCEQSSGADRPANKPEKKLATGAAVQTAGPPSQQPTAGKHMRKRKRPAPARASEQLLKRPAPARASDQPRKRPAPAPASDQPQKRAAAEAAAAASEQPGPKRRKRNARQRKQKSWFARKSNRGS